MERIVNVSIDIDGLACYHRIHGVAGAADPTLMYSTAMPRFLDMCDRLDIRATLFVIASDLEHGRAVELLRDAIERGHEVASHSYHHPYNLSEWPQTSIGDEIDRASEAIIDTLGVRPRGFRAPGYNIDTRILRILAERGYLYDSSVFPCPYYYVAKAGVMALMAAKGTPSGSSMTRPGAILAPTQPYRPSRHQFYKRGNRKHSLPMWEIPIGVMKSPQVPVIGTTVGALPGAAVKHYARAFAFGQRTLQFEMHAIDFLDSRDPGLSGKLIARQRDLKRPQQSKIRNYETFLSTLGKTHRFRRLDELARLLDQEAGPTVIED